MAFSSFGTANTAQQPTNLFGSAPAASSSTGGGFGFGGSTSGGGLFGSTAAKPSLTVSAPGASGSTGLFGQQQQQPQQQQPQQQTGGLFGQQQQQQQQQPAGGLFGSTQSTTQPSGGLFGQQQTQQQPAAGGLFGSTSQPGAGTSGGLFGAKPATTTGGLFGSTSQQQQPAAGGLFGSTSQQPQQSGGLFGSTSQQPQQGGGLFGSTAQPSGMFGSTAQAPKPMFGAAPLGQNTLGASTLGASTLGHSTLGQSTLGHSLDVPKQEESIEQRITNIRNAWNVESPDCRFKYFFYNVVDEGTTQFYGRPAGATDDAKWARAVRDNPDPTTMVPVLATGWGDVQKRVQAMNQTASVHQQRVKELNEALANLNRQTALSASVRLSALQAHLLQLSQRLIHLAAMTPTFAPAQSSAFRPEEGEMKHALEAVKDTVDGRIRSHTSKSVGLAVAPRSQNKGRMLGQINELWGALEEVRRQRRVRGDTSWAGDERMLAELATVLEQQQVALTKLSELASNAVFDADVIRAGLNAVDDRK